ncbi:MAG: lumazine-binding protein [Mycobacterium sp.]
MTGSDSGSEPIQLPEPEPDRPTLAPFVGGLAVFALVVIGIILFNVFGTQQTTPGDQVAQAAVGQNDALQSQDYAKFRNFTCLADQGTEASFLSRQRDSVAKNGERYVNDVPTIRVDGERATATVIYHFANAVEQTSSSDLTFVREDGAWKVCSK